MADGKKQGLTPEQWADVRKAYEAGESILALSKQYKVKRDTIAAHRDRETWVIGHDVGHMPGKTEQRAVREQTQSNVIDMMSRRVVDQVEKAGVIDEMATDLRNTIMASKIASEYAVDILTRAKDGKIRPASSPGEQTEADVFKSVMAGYKTFASMTREIAGLRPGMATAGAQDDGEKKRIDRPVLVVRPAATETRTA